MSTDQIMLTLDSGGVQPEEPSERTRPEDRCRLDEEWRAGAEAALAVLAATGRPFSSDDLRATEGGLEAPRHPNHLGAIFSAASARGLIKPAGFAVSATPSRRGGLLRLWQGVEPSAAIE